MLNHLEQMGDRYGLMTMWEAGGLANATIIERLYDHGRQIKPVRIAIDGDDGCRARLPGGHNRRHSHRADAADDNAGTRFDPQRLEHCTRSGLESIAKRSY